MYIKVKEFQNILPNDSTTIIFDENLVFQTGDNHLSPKGNYVLRTINLNSLAEQEKKIEGRYSVGIRINSNSMIFFKYDEKVASFELKNSTLYSKLILKNKRFNPFRIAENYLVFENQGSGLRKGGVYHYLKNQILFEKENFYPYGFVDNYLFDVSLGNSINIKHLNTQNGELKWQTNLDYYISGLEKKEKDKVYLIGVWNNQLIVQFDSILLLFLNISSGKVIDFIDFRKEVKPKYLGGFYRNLILIGDKLCLLQSFYFMEINLNEKKINCLKPLMLGLTRNELRKSYSFGSTSRRENNILFVAKKNSNAYTFIGLFNTNSKEIQWSINTNKEVMSPIMSNDKFLYFIDTDKVLHLYKRQN